MISTNFIAEQQEELDYKLAEVQTMKDQLALMDVSIDRYDTIIGNIDKQIIPLVKEINDSIDVVKTAYDNRITAGCKSDLYWEVTSTKSYFSFFPSVPIVETVYTCKKNPNVRVDYGYYGAKYYRRPQNQDYGSNIVREFLGTIGSGSTTLVVLGIDGTTELLVGDDIVDNIDNPVIFVSNNLPTIVGFGTTSIARITTDFGGSVSFGSTIIANVGVGTTIGINAGDSITLAGILDTGTTIVGFGTTTIIVNNVWDTTTGSFITTDATTDSLIISLPAVGTGTTIFKVGPLDTYPTLILDAESISSGTNTNFTNIRTTQTDTMSFDYSNNPIDPVTVGILNCNTISVGHKLVRVNDGSPIGPFQWQEVMTAEFAGKPDSQLNESEQYLRETYPEPACGAGYARYYPGNNQWPIKNTFIYGFGGYPPLSSNFAYAQEGDTITVGSGLTSLFGIGYKNVSSINPSAGVCNPLDAAITAAEANRDAIIARNLPKIDSLITASNPLRDIRNTMESRAFAMLQGRVYGDVEINKLNQNLSILKSTDYSPFELLSYSCVPQGTSPSGGGGVVSLLNYIEYNIPTARQELIRTSPVDWEGLSSLQLPAITDNTLLTNSDVDNTLQQWMSSYPTVSVDVMGQTVQNRPQKIARLFDDGLKPIIGISCGIHGNEIESLRGWITALEWLITSTNAIAVEVRNSLTIYFVPLFNPDGTSLNQRNNANNVNLNRNWPYFFDSVLDPDKGSAGLSEPETNNFATYMLAASRAQRSIGWVDVHDWSSQTTFGLLHEKIYHTPDTVQFARSMYNHSNALLKLQNYSAINGPVTLREYMMNRKAYLVSWVINNAQPGCWGGLIEFPESESVSLSASVAQDFMMSFALAGLQQTGSSVQGKIIESSTYTSTVNNNANLQAWSSTEPRPQFFSGTGVSLTQVFDASIDRNVVEIERPNTIELQVARAEAAYTVVPQTDGRPVLYLIGGKTLLDSRITSVLYLNTVSRQVSELSAFPIAANYMAATNDGTNIYVSGGFSTTYVDAIYKSSGTGLSVTFSTFLASMSVYTTGIQRHSMDYWPASNYLIISGGRDSVNYKTGIYAVDTASGYIWRIGNFITARGWHTTTVYNNSLYAFGGWTGGTVLLSAEKLTLTDNKVATGTDGAIASVNQFSSSQYVFTTGDVGRTITIQQSSNKGEYTIASFINSTTVTVSPAPPANNTTGHAFVLSTAPSTASAITSLPATRHRQQIVQDGAIAYLFGGMPTSTTWSSSLYKYDMSSNTVTTVSYTMDEFLDEESGVVTSLETPTLASTAGYYDYSSNSVVIAGGFDELSLARKDIYEIDLGDAICFNWLYELEAYGFMRMTQVFSNQKAMLVAAIKNMTAINNTKAPYVRITALIGPLNSPTRKVRTWYQVPSTSEYDVFMMPLQLEAGETEFRCYIRHYTAGTTIRVASFQLLEGEEKLTFPLPLDYIKTPDIYNVTLVDPLSFSTSSRFLAKGSMMPLVNVNIVVTEIPLITFYGISDELLFTLSYTSTSDGSTNYAATGKGTLKLIDAINSTTESRTSFEINGNRLAGKEIRYDVISWQIEKTASTNNLMLSWYGEIISFSLAAMPPTKELKRIAFSNGIFSSISGYSQTV
jgi:hypothetical protein